MAQFSVAKQILPRVFFFSGISSLLFQVASQRLLTLYYGVGPVSVTLIVSVYMLGLGIGGWLGGKVADQSKKPFQAYFLVELSLAIFSVLSLPYLSFIARATAGANVWISLASMMAFLLIPTVLMGMTLPLVVKLFNKYTDDFLGSVSYLYAVNTMGAAAGALIAAFLLISFLGIDYTIYASAAIEIMLALAIFAGLKFSTKEQEQTKTTENREVLPTTYLLGKHAYPFVFLTGILAIGYEIVWFRFLQILVKSSPYAFASTLAVYLFGLALGSHVMNTIVVKRPKLDKPTVFFLLQAVIGVFVVLSVGLFYHSASSWLRPLIAMSYTGIGITGLLAKVPFLFLILWPLIFVFIPTMLMGASFPLITYSARTRDDDEGSAVGTTYFFNTAGNIVGGLVTGFILLPSIGTENTMLAFACIGIAMLLFAKRFWKFNRLSHQIPVAVLLIALSVLIMPRTGQLYLCVHNTGIPEDLRSMWQDYIKEGISGVVVTHANPPDGYQVVINGLGHGRRPDYKYYRESVEALSYAPNKESVLIIGFGGGSTAETILRIPEVQKITVVEINDALIGNLRQLELFRKILDNPKISLILEDCRRYLLSTQEKFDMILLDPLRTSEAYSNNIYSLEFFQLVKSHLKEPGMVLVWLDEHKVLPKTIASVFPHVRVYNYFCLASLGPFEKDFKTEQELISSFTKEQQMEFSKYKTEYLGDKNFGLDHAKDYPVNEDMRPITEYYLGMIQYEIPKAP